MESIDNPIFVRGLSRSGGTLMCTLLDAHRDVAMSYELYPNLLETDADYDLAGLPDLVRRSKRGSHLTKIMPTERFAIFINRCDRGGLKMDDVADLFQQLVDEGHHTSEAAGRYRMMELCGLSKMHKLGKARWGMKCNNAYDEYLSFWPNAGFLNMVRDGRDVLASQLNTGNFKNSPSQLGASWAKTHSVFNMLTKRDGVRARAVIYETLTTNPEPELREICKTVDLEFDPTMLAHAEQDLTVFKTHHLSHARITRPIDSTQIGRWRNDLTPRQVEEFTEAAGNSLKQYGYE